MALTGVANFAIAQASTQLQVAGISIFKPNPESEYEQSLSGYQAPGVQIHLHYKLSGQTILSINQKKTRIVAKTDDGINLLLVDEYDRTYNIDKDREKPSQGTVVFGSTKLPTSKSQQISLQGSLVLAVGKEPKTEESMLKIADGSKLDLGVIKAVVVKREGDSQEEDNQMIELSSKTPFDTVVNLEFIDSKGKLIETSPAGSGSSSDFTGATTYMTAFYVQSGASELKVRATFFTKTEEVTVPVDLTFGLGL